MKKKRVILLLLIAIIGAVVWLNYPKLNIMTGYSAKSMASSVFLADRDFTFTDEHDNNFSPVSLAKDVINAEDKIATSSVFGLKERTAIYREGLGSVLVPEDIATAPVLQQPNRNFKSNDSLHFPYGSLPQKDTLFPNINYNKLNSVLQKYTETETKTRAIVIVYENQIIGEQYIDGIDENSLLLGWSMTKSITSTLFGILESQNRIDLTKSAPISEWKNDKRGEITIENLLEMNSGLEWEEDYGTISDVTKMLFLEPDMTTLQIYKPLVGKTNASWNYSSGTTNLLSGILRKEIGDYQNYLDFPYSALIDKIGMSSMLLETDYSGNYVGSSYGWATARDWAKFGLLYLHKGNWNGNQIFNEDWYNYAINPTNSSNGRYGAQIWLNAGGFLPDVPKDIFSFNGFQGQRIYIIPSKDMVVVRLGLGKLDFNEFLSEILDAVQ